MNAKTKNDDGHIKKCTQHEDNDQKRNTTMQIKK